MSDVEALALQVLLPGFEGTTLREDEAALLADGLGGVCLFGSNLPFAPYVDQLRALAPDLVVATDEEGGDVTRLHYRDGSPVLSAAALGVLDDPALTRVTHAGIGTALRDHGITLDFAPIADVNTNPDNPVIGVRSFASNPVRAARHVAAAVTGLRSAGAQACVKHYPGHGDTHEDSHLALPSVDSMPDPAPFVAAIEAGAEAIMTSHIVVGSIDPDLPATLSPAVLRILRSELGFDGVIVSDALDMAGASATRGIPAAAVLALVAGCDLLCLGPDLPASLVREVQQAIADAIESGALEYERLAEAGARVRRLAGITPEPVRAPVDEAAQVAAAARALRVEGDLPDLTGALTVRVETEPSPAVGTVPWSLPSVAIDPATFATAGEGAGDAVVVVQARDAHRHPAIVSLLEGLPRAVLLELGWPGPRTGAHPRITTYGASRPALQAAADLLATKGWSA